MIGTVQRLTPNTQPMKLLTIIPILAILASCSTSGIRMSRIAQQESISTAPLGERIKAEIALTENKYKGECRNPIIRRVALRSSSRGGSGAIISAREDWIVNRCGIDVVYEVDYYGPINESTNIHVKKIRR